MTAVKFGISASFPCGYLPDKEEQLLVYADIEPMSSAMYSALQNQGFRRSEDHVYKPYCDNCSACTPVRLNVYKYKPSKSQKRILNKANGFRLQLSDTVSPDYYPLFESYINHKHSDGVMFPANIEQLNSFSKCKWMPQLFLEVYDQESLIAVAICDVTADSLSAVYTFYDHRYSNHSLGTLMVVQQINLAKELGKNWLYLGYHIASCQKMNYKTRFLPFQLFEDGIWTEYPKK